MESAGATIAPEGSLWLPVRFGEDSCASVSSPCPVTLYLADRSVSETGAANNADDNDPAANRQFFPGELAP